MIQLIFLSVKMKILVIFQLAIFQIPREVPHPSNNSPIDLSKPEDVIIYIILPLIIAALYFIGKRSRKRRKNLKTHEDQSH